MKKFYSWYKKHITAAIFTGLILGIITGLFLANRFEPVLAITSLIGSIYMNALNMMIFPLVFCSIIMGISSIGNARTTGKITAGAMIFFLCTTALASLAGLIIPRLIHLGEGVKFEMATSDIQATEMTSILDTSFRKRKYASGTCIRSHRRLHTYRHRRKGYCTSESHRFL